MTYLQFHLIFTLPVIFYLKMTGPKVFARDMTKATISLVVIASIAFIWTTPWDNYLIQEGIWGYGQGRVLGTLGYVPVEEYFFFLAQPLLTGFWLYRLIWKSNLIQPASPSNRARYVGSAFMLLLSLTGVALLSVESARYLALILVWACPMLFVQWLYGGHHLWRLRKLCFVAVSLPTLYLWGADRIALHLGIWHISDQFTTGAHLFGLPFEEALFFLVTNMLVVQGLVLMLHTWNVKALRQEPAVFYGNH